MNDRPINKRHRILSKQALGWMRVGLALVFLALGASFLLLPRIADDLERAGISPGFRLVLAVSHLAGGLALLVPRVAGKAALVLIAAVAASAIYLRAEGMVQIGVGPAVLVALLLLFGVGLRLRQRVDASVWREMLARYADQQDSLRSENA
jgi:hypothetical protein